MVKATEHLAKIIIHIIPHAKIVGKSQNIPELNGGFQRNITYKSKIFQPRLMREEGNLILVPSRARAKRVFWRCEHRHPTLLEANHIGIYIYTYTYIYISRYVFAKFTYFWDVLEICWINLTSVESVGYVWRTLLIYALLTMIHSFRWTSEAADVELGASHSNKSESNRVMWAPQKNKSIYHLGRVYTSHLWWFWEWFIVVLTTFLC
jgi:hypothetical protein